MSASPAAGPILGIVLGLILAVFGLPAARQIYGLSIPTSRWVEIKSIEVLDAPQGTAPEVLIDWSIRQPFLADWTATVRRKSGEGFYAFCGRSGVSDYRPGSVMPIPSDLLWWLGIPPHPLCPELPPGEYLFTVVLTLRLDALPPKTVRVESNVFTIHEAIR